MSYHTDEECISLERYALTVLTHSSRITDRVWRVQISLETCHPGAATAVLLFCVKQKMFHCPRYTLCLKKDEMNEGDIPPITDAKVAGGTGAHSRLSWPTCYQLDCSEFKKLCTVESIGSLIAHVVKNDGERWMSLSICLIYHITSCPQKLPDNLVCLSHLEICKHKYLRILKWASILL